QGLRLMSVVFNEETDGAGIHALIIGVTRYSHLEGGDGRRAADTCRLTQLSCAVQTTVAMFEWLINHQEFLPLPLMSCRLLISASPDELASNAPPRGYAEATLEEVLAAASEWRRAAASNRDNVTIFYFAGHGVQRTRT